MSCGTRAQCKTDRFGRVSCVGRRLEETPEATLEEPEAENRRLEETPEATLEEPEAENRRRAWWQTHNPGFSQCLLDGHRFRHGWSGYIRDHDADCDCDMGTMSCGTRAQCETDRLGRVSCVGRRLEENPEATLEEIELDDRRRSTFRTRNP